MFFWIVLVLHVLLSLGLTFLVLLHSGKGGGLSDMFGGGLGAAAAGSTSMERNLDRLTIVMGLIFTFLTIILAFIIVVPLIKAVVRRIFGRFI